MAAKTESQLRDDVAFNFPDNTEGLVTPKKVRTVLGDILTKIFDKEVGNINGLAPITFDPYTLVLSMPPATESEDGYLTKEKAAYLRQATDVAAGFLRFATEIEAIEGDANNVAMTPAQVKAKVNELASGFGIATPDTVPDSGINIYSAKGAGTYTNFLDDTATPIEVTSGDLSGGVPQLWRVGAAWELVVIPIPIPRATTLNPEDTVELQTGKTVSDWVKEEISPSKYFVERVPEVCNGVDVAAIRTIIINQEITEPSDKVVIFCVSAGQITLGAFVKDGSGNIYRDHGLSVNITPGINVIDFPVSPGQFIGYFKQAAGGGVGRITADFSADYWFYSFTVGVSTTPVPLVPEQHNARYGIKVLAKEEYANFDKSVSDVIINSAETDDIYRKNLVFFGDSITSIAIPPDNTPAHPQNYAERVAIISRAASNVNFAISGATYSWKPGTVDDPNPLPSSDSNVISNQVLKYLDLVSTPTPDIAIFSAGINDVFAEPAIGDIPSIFNANIADLDKQQFAAAIRYTVEKFRAEYPSCFIAIMTPLHSTVTGRKYDDALPYVEAIKECASRLNIPVIDCFNNVQMPEIRASALFSDGLHPNGLGKEIQFRYVWNWLKNNYYRMA